MLNRRLPAKNEDQIEKESPCCSGQHLSDQELELINKKIKYDFIRDIYAITARVATAAMASYLLLKPFLTFFLNQL